MAVKIKNKELNFIYLLILHEEFSKAQKSTLMTNYEIAQLSQKLKGEISDRIANLKAIKEQEEFIQKNKNKLTIKPKK